MLGIRNSTDTAAFVRTVQDASALVAKLQERHGTEQSTIAEAQAGLRTAALAVETGGDGKAYDKAVSELDRLKRDHMQTADALAAARQQLATAQRQLREATRADRVKDAEKLASQRLKAIQAFVAATEEQYRARQKLHEVDLKALESFPSLNVNHGGTLLATHEMERALETELARISSPPPLTPGACPALPGSRSYTFGNPASAEPLVSVIEAANALLVRLVTDEPGPQAIPLEPSIDDDDAILALQPEEAVETFDAAEVLAGIQPQKLTV